MPWVPARPGRVAHHDESRGINVKNVHRLRCEEGPRVRVHSPRKRARTSSAPEAIADAPKVEWASDFQFDSTIDGKAIKIGPMVESTPTSRCCTWWIARSPLNGSSPNPRGVFAVTGGPPQVLRMGNGQELVSQALQSFCNGRFGLSYVPPRDAPEQRLHRIVQQLATEGMPQTQPLDHHARGAGGDQRLQGGTQHTAPPLSAGLRDPGRVRCRLQPSHYPMAYEIN
jgi:putative transposase